MMQKKIAKYAGRLTRSALNLTGRNGTSLPGKVALKIDPDFFAKSAEGAHIIAVTGTNGKTMTSSLIVHALEKAGFSVLTNASGANMLQGIAGVFLASDKTISSSYCVLEIDEATLPLVAESLHPEWIVFTNLFEDQTDRYANIEMTYSYLKKAAELSPDSKLIINGDCPILATGDLPNERYYFGFALDAMENEQLSAGVCPNCGGILSYTGKTYGDQGLYTCKDCGFKRPDLTWELTSLDHLDFTGSRFTIHGTTFDLPVAGVYNIYNALAAYAVATTCKVPDRLIAEAFTEMPKVFGRQERVRVGNKEVVLHLMKNPVGFNQIVDTIALDDASFALMSILNDRPADGTDIAWINEVDFEGLVTLTAARPVITSGLRGEDLSERMVKAGVAESDLVMEKNLEQLDKLITASTENKVHALVTYTALLDLRRVWIKQGYITE